MPVPVRDAGANKPELIEHAAEVLGRSRVRTAVFREIYTGKRAIKTVAALMNATKQGRIAVLNEGKKLADAELVEQVKLNGLTGYKKIRFFQTHRDRILRFALNPTARKAVPTKRRPAGSAGSKGQKLSINIRAPKAAVRAMHITLDDIASFQRVTNQPPSTYLKIPETTFKKGVARILGEPGTFKDWGGESRDLSSTRLRIDGRRLRVAFAFKGPGTPGRLTPGKMGKNGDQIQRLVRCPADVFIVQYWAEIDDNVLEQLEKLVQLKSYLENRKLFFGVVDGNDSGRLIRAYPKSFPKKFN